MSTATARAPFLDLSSFSVEEAPPPRELLASGAPARSPFLPVYECSNGEALFELQCSARAMHDEQLTAGKPRAEADRLVMQHYSPLIRESGA